MLDGREIVIGTGSSEIIAAGLYALSGGTAAAVNRSHSVPASAYYVLTSQRLHCIYLARHAAPRQ